MKPDYQIKNVKLYCRDNMEFMKQVPDNYYNLAIVDPPYGIGVAKIGQWGGGGEFGKGKYNPQSAKSVKPKNYGAKKWDVNIPDKKYFNELLRISKNQIIWGGNYFIEYLHNTPCFIIWDKVNGESNFADCELAWTSFATAVRKIVFKWNGMLQQDMKEKEKRIHITQKPVGLYKWILQKYAEPGDKIFDSHGGSFSSACACLDMGFDFDGCEIDREYFDNAVERLKNNVQEYLDFT